MRIDIYFDAVCPWCFIGSRRLASALALRPQIHASITWKPYLLNPQLPDDGIDSRVYIEQKFGDKLRAAHFLSSLEKTGRSVGIPFAFSAITHIPPTLRAHLLIRLAHETGQQNEAVAAVFSAHFIEGKDINDIDVLKCIGSALGLNEKKTGQAFADQNLITTLGQEAEMALRAGTVGVPQITFDDMFRITGAHEPEVLVRLIDAAATAENESGKTSLPEKFTPPHLQFS